MKALWKDGRVFAGATSDDVLQAVKDSSPFTARFTLAEYREALGDFIAALGLGHVRTTSSREYLLDLERLGLIIIRED